VLLAGSDERVFGPYWAAQPQVLVFEPLAVMDSLGNLEGRLARTLEHSPDYREWTIHLRTDVRWHDGVPVTAHDVKARIDITTHPDVLWTSPDVKASVIDDSTVVIFDPAEGGRDVLLEHPYPAHLVSSLDPAAIYSWDFWIRPVGTGPYRYVRHIPETMVELEANPDYYRGPPAIDRLVLKFGGNTVTELLAGQADVAEWPTPNEAALLGRDDRFDVYWEAFHIPQALVWRAGSALLADKQVRRAFTHAVDRPELGRVLDLSDSVPIFDGVVTERQFRRSELPELLPYDPHLARRLLESAGWVDTDGDGIRERAGEAARLELVVTGEQAAIGVYLQAALLEVGVELLLATMAPAARRSRWESGAVDGVIGSVSANFMLNRLSAERSPETFANDRITELVGRLDGTVAPPELDRFYRELTDVFREQQPFLFLHPYTNAYVVHRRVRGLSSPWSADPLANIEHLWIER
jgi:peptide/nickel transport system substrate-binding protein